MIYKLSSGLHPDSHSSDNVIYIKDEKGNSLGCFEDQFDAFDYIKINLEKDKKYEQYIEHPDMFIMEIYNKLSKQDKELLLENIVQKYRYTCMLKYFNL